MFFKTKPNGGDKVELENSGRFVLKEKMIPKQKKNKAK